MAFDVEEYRADLERRYLTLAGMAETAYFLASEGALPNSTYSDRARRYENKARGLRIALDLLPKPPEPRPEEQVQPVPEPLLRWPHKSLESQETCPICGPRSHGK